MDQESTLFDVLINGTKLTEVIMPTQQERLFLAPSSINLSAADLLMASAPGRERKLARALSQVKDFDYILIDTPPNLGVLTVNAFIACTDVVIPIALTTYALIGIGILERTMQELRDNLDVELPIFGVIANLDDHTKLSADVLGAVREHFGDRVFQTVIPSGSLAKSCPVKQPFGSSEPSEYVEERCKQWWHQNLPHDGAAHRPDPGVHAAFHPR